MNDKIGLMMEAEKRGILPPDKAALLAEARKRGLVSENKTIDVGKTALDALKGAGVAGAVTLGGRALSMFPHPLAKVVGGAISSQPVLNLLSGATGEAARSSTEQLGGGGLEQFGASILGGLSPFGISSAVKSIPSALAKVGAKSTVQGITASEKLATKQLGEAFSRDADVLSGLSPEQSILQKAGTGITGRAETIMTRGGEASDTLAKYVSERQGQLPTELSEFLGKKFQAHDLPKIRATLQETAKSMAKEGYQKAYDFAPKINNPEINEILDRIVAAGDWPKATEIAKRLAAYEGRKFGTPDATGTSFSMSTQDLDYLTRALRDKGWATEGTGGFGGFTAEGKARANAAGRIRDILKEQNPAFRDVTKKYGDALSLDEAADIGKKTNLFGSNWKQAVSDYKQMTPYEQQMWRLGQAENLQTKIDSNPFSALRQFNTPQFKKVMKNFYSEKELDALTKKLASRALEQSSLQKITGSSRTAARGMQQADDLAQNSELGTLAMDALSGGKAGIVKNVMNRAKPILEKKFGIGMTQKNADNLISEIITNPVITLAIKETTGKPNELTRVIRGALATSQGKSALQRAIKRGAFDANPAALTLINTMISSNVGEK